MDKKNKFLDWVKEHKWELITVVGMGVLAGAACWYGYKRGVSHEKQAHAKVTNELYPKLESDDTFVHDMWLDDGVFKVGTSHGQMALKDFQTKVIDTFCEFENSAGKTVLNGDDIVDYAIYMEKK